MIDRFARLRGKNRRTTRRISRNWQPSAFTARSNGPMWRAIYIEELEDRRLLTVSDYADMANNLQTDLKNVRDDLHTAVNAVHFGTFGTLPMVDNLGSQVEDEFDQIIQPIHDAIGNLDPNSSPATALQTALFDILGPSHLGILVDRATSSTTTNVGPEDVSVSFVGGQYQVEARLFIPVAAVSNPANFDLGLPGLPFQLSTAGKLTTSLGMAYELAFDTDPVDGSAFLDTTKTLSGFTPPAADDNFPTTFLNHPLAFFVSTTPSADFSATARLGFVEGDLTPVDPSIDSNSANGLSLTVTVDELNSAPVIAVNGQAAVNMTLHGSFATSGSDDFPGIDTDLHFSWQIDSTQPDLNPPKVGFDHVALDLGHVISDLVKPVLDKIHDATKNLDPVLDILNTPIPGLSDLANLAGLGNVTLLTLAGAAAPFTGYGPLFDLTDKVTKVLTLVENIENNSGDQFDSTLKVPLGGFDLNGTDLTNLVPAGDIGNLEAPDLTNLSPDDVDLLISSAQDFQAAIAKLGLPPDVTSLFNQITAGLNANSFSIDFPILDDPSHVVFNLLLGRDSDLVDLTAKAHVVSQADLGPTGLSILGQGIDYHGKVNLDLNFKFAYDTFGLRELINQIADGGPVDVLSDIGDGFYIGGDSFFTLAGSIDAEAGLSLGVFNASVSGGASTDNNGTTPVSITVDDPPADGKKRFDGTQLFDTSGEFVAGLNVDVSIGKSILGQFIGVKKDFDIANKTLVSFSPPEPIALASQPDANGNVVLYLGVNSNLRVANGVPATDGDDTFTISHVDPANDVDPLGEDPDPDPGAGGETIEVDAFGVSQKIRHVKSISAVDGVGVLNINVLPGVTSNVNFQGGQGQATLIYKGTGTAVLIAGQASSDLEGGFGSSVLTGGPGDDTITLGHGANTVTGGGGHNTILVNAPVSADGTINAGTAPGNSLVILTDGTTQNLSATTSGAQMDLAVTAAGGNPPTHLITTGIGDILVNAVNRLANVTLGDLSTIGVTRIVVDAKTTHDTGRQFTLDSGAGLAAATIYVSELDATDTQGSSDVEQGADIFNHTTGTDLQLFGLSGDDIFTLQQHGGSLNIQPLPFSSGLFLIDDSGRLAGAAESIQMLTPTQDNGINLVAKNKDDDFSIVTNAYLSFLIHGDDALDSLTMEVSAPGLPAGKNTLSFDGSQFHGALKVDSLGTSTAQDDFTLSAVASDLTTSFDGHATSTVMHFGTGQLAEIQHSSTVANVTLFIDDSGAPSGSYLEMTTTDLGAWTVPNTNLAPSLSYSNLEGTLTIAAGAGDRFQLDATPPSITAMEVSNNTDTLDPVYTANWSVPLTLDGALALFLGEKLRSDNTVERVEHLTSVQTSFTLNRGGDPATKIVLDAALDAPGASYSIGGHTLNSTNMFVTKAGTGLDVEMNDLRPASDVPHDPSPPDELRMDLTGAAVSADLQFTPNNTITFDGSDRFSGENPTAANTYSVSTEGLGIDMEPVGPNDTRTTIGNTMNVIGSMPQDALSIYVLMDVSGAAYPTTLDGSELRGQLNVAATDVSPGTLEHYLEQILDVPGPTPTLLPIAYSSENILLKAARSDLSVNLAGTSTYDSIILTNSPGEYAPLDQYPDVYTFVQQADSAERHLVGPPVTLDWTLTAAASSVTIGDGTLAKIQGPVSVSNASLTIDDRQGTDANIIQTTTTTVTGWATPGNSHPTLTVGTVYGEFAFHASPTDRFNITGTPVHWWELNAGKTEFAGDGVLYSVSISADGKTLTQRASTYDDELFFHDDRNVIDNAGSGATSDVYITGKDMMPMSITGNFHLYAGRQLLPDGSVAEGTVDNLIRPPLNKLTRQQPIAFTYTGPGTGTAIWDASQDILTQSFINSMSGKPFYGVFASPLNPGLGTLYYLDGDYVTLTERTNDQNGTLISMEEDVRGQLVYGSNTELTFDAPQYPTDLDLETVFDNPLTAPVHYYSNPADGLNVQEEVAIYQSAGPVDVHGAPGATNVILAPPRGTNPIVTDDGPEGTINVVPYLSSEQYLTNSVQGDVYVSDAAIQIQVDNGGTVAPPVLPTVVVTQTAVTGLTGGIIHMSDLSNMAQPYNGSDGPAEKGGRTAGLYINLPSYGTASTTIEDTPGGVITALDEFTGNGANPNSVTVLATTGGLAFATHYNGPTIGIGNGTLDNIKGSLYFNVPVHAIPTTFDGHLDSSRTVAAAAQPFGSLFGAEMTGLTPAPIFMGQSGTAITDFKVLSGDDDTFNLSYAGGTTPPWQIFAGLRNTVNVFPGGTNFPTPGLEIYGAQTVNATIVNQMIGANVGVPLKVFASLDRPTDPIDLNLDFSGVTTNSSPYTSLVLERASSTQGDIRGIGISNAQQVVFPSNLTHVSVKTGATSAITTFTISDTPVANATIDPGRATVNVNGTSGPLTILQGGTSAAQVLMAPLTSNMQAIAGPVTIVANDNTRPRLPVRLSDNGDSTGRNAQFSISGNTTTLTGLAAASIAFQGTLADVTIVGGTGSNTLGGPDTANTWNLTATNAGKLNSMFTYSGFANLRGGSSTDDFYFVSGASVTGNVDAGDGVDTAHYAPGVLNGSETINLAAGILPKINGSATNFEAVDIETHVALVNPGNQVSGKAHPITPLTIQVTGGGGTRSFSASGLPTGLSIDPLSGVISGTVAGTVADNTVFNTTVTVSDSTGTASASFTWKVASGLALANPSTQIGKYFNNANVPIGLNNDFGTNVTFSAQNLPPGLSIDPQTGVISGTYLPGTVSPIVAPVTVSATDGVHSSQVNFEWFVSDSAGTNRADLAGADGGVITLVSSAGAQLKASYFDPASLGAPTSGYSLPLGGIELEIDGLARGGNTEITITPPRGENLDQLLDLSSAGWVNLLGQGGSTSARVSGGSLIVDLADGGPGEFNPAFDGTILAYLAPASRQLTAAIGNAPTQLTAGQAVTFTSDLAGTLAPLATSTWQLSLNSNVVQTATGADFSFAAQQPGYYTIALSASDPASGISATAQVSITVSPSLGTLNAGTPAGTPFLAGLVDPTNNGGIESITPITFSNLAGAPARTYFVTFDLQTDLGDVWQYDGSQTSPVLVEGTSQQLSGITATIDVDGRWAAMVDSNNGNIWAVTPDGARLIVSAADGLAFIQNPAAVGDTLYFSAQDTAGNQLHSVRLDDAGNPVLARLTNLFDETGSNFFALRALTPFDGGLAFIDTVGPYEDGVEPSDEVFVLTGGPNPTVKQLSIDPPVGFPNIPSLAVVDDADGSSRLMFARYGSGSPTSVYSLDSSHLSDPNPAPTKVDIAAAGANVQIDEFVGVGAQVYFTAHANGSFLTDLWVSDGTAAGTAQLGAGIDYLSPFSLANLDGELNFLGGDAIGDTSLWTIDAASGQPVEVADVGIATQLFSAAGNLYLKVYDGATDSYRLWTSAGGTSQPVQVPSNPNNPYTEPSEITADNQGVVYFSAYSPMVPDGFGNPTNQLWVLGPAYSAGGAAAVLNIAAPTDALAGSTPTVTINATTAAGDPAADFAGSVSIELDDSDGNAVFTTSGNFSGGLYSFQLQQLTTAGAADTTYTLHVASSDLAAQASITVHPIVHFGPTANTTVVAGTGQTFSLGMQADDDRQLFAANYAGQVTLSYMDSSGTHLLGPVSAAQGIVTFTGIVLPAPGTYTFTATSADGLATGSFVVTVPKAIQFTPMASDPTRVSTTDVFDFDVIAQDVAGNPAAGYTGLVLVTLTDPNGASASTSYWVGPDQQSHLLLRGLNLPVEGLYRLRVSDGIVSNTFTIQAAQKQVVPGDLNNDGTVDATDIDTLFGLIAAGDARGDLNSDGAVNQLDLDYLIHNILHTEYGDANLDGFVDTSDLATVRINAGRPLAGPDWASGDFNGDGFVDTADLAVVRRHMGFASTANSSSEAASTPNANVQSGIAQTPTAPTPAIVPVASPIVIALPTTEASSATPMSSEPKSVVAATAAPSSSSTTSTVVLPGASSSATSVVASEGGKVATEPGDELSLQVADESKPTIEAVLTPPPASVVKQTASAQPSLLQPAAVATVVQSLTDSAVDHGVVARQPAARLATSAVTTPAQLRTVKVAAEATLAHDALSPAAHRPISPPAPGSVPQQVASSLAASTPASPTSGVLMQPAATDERALRKALAAATESPADHGFGEGLEELIDLLATKRRSSASKPTK